MAYRVLQLSVAGLALALFAGSALARDDAKKTDADRAAEQADRHEGTVIRATADALVMKGKAKDGEEAAEHTHRLAENAKVTCDGKACMLEDLKPGQKVRVTTKRGDKSMATRVEALDKNEQFEKGKDKDADKDGDNKDRR